MSDSPSSVPPVASGRPRRILWWACGFVVVWFLGAEIFTHYWYASREGQFTLNVMPRDADVALERLKGFVKQEGSQFRQQNIGTAAMEMLKCRFGESIYWMADGEPAAATILKWDDFSVYNGVEGMHNPGICLGSAGWIIHGSKQLGLQRFGGADAEVSEWEVSRPSLEMRAFSAVFRRFASTGVVAQNRFFFGQRLDAVLAGRRDAPIYIILVYLPESLGEKRINAMFRELVDAIFSDGATPASTGNSSPS